MTSYDELRADLDTVVGLLHELEARMAVRIEEHARMKAALEYYADSTVPDRDGGIYARFVLRSLSKENP